MTEIQRLSQVATPQLADAVLRVGGPLRLGPPGLLPLRDGERVAGRACVVSHSGSVDVFLEALESSHPGDVLVIDDGGERNHACIGDLTVLEMRAAGLAGVVVWGVHRDHAELIEIGFPVFSLGRAVAGPLHARARASDALERAHCGPHAVTRGDVVVGDDNGVIFLEQTGVARILEVAEEIRATEQDQAARIANGETLRDQLGFARFLQRRTQQPDWTFREHLRERGGEIEQ